VPEETILDLASAVPQDWKEKLSSELNEPWFVQLQEFLNEEWQRETIFPAKKNIFSALKLTPFDQVKVLILGQDPYHDENQAHGLCFSVTAGQKFPPSLRNIFKELQADLRFAPPEHGCLEHWARQGVLLLNTVLTVRAHLAASHQGRGWEKFTDAIIREVNAKPSPVVFVLWGNHAQKKLSLIDSKRHHVICTAHPSPLSATRGFVGSRPFSKINAALTASGLAPINWAATEEKSSQLKFEF